MCCRVFASNIAISGIHTVSIINKGCFNEWNRVQSDRDDRGDCDNLTKWNQSLNNCCISLLWYPIIQKLP